MQPKVLIGRDVLEKVADIFGGEEITVAKFRGWLGKRLIR